MCCAKGCCHCRGSASPQQMGPGSSPTHTQAAAASSPLLSLLQPCRWQENDGKAPLVPNFSGVRGQAPSVSTAWLQPPGSLCQA